MQGRMWSWGSVVVTTELLLSVDTFFQKHHLSGFFVLLWQGSKQDLLVFENKVAEKLVFTASDYWSSSIACENTPVFKKIILKRPGSGPGEPFCPG